MKIFDSLLSVEDKPIGYKLIFYKTMMLPIMTYAAIVWTSTAKTHLNRLDVVQKRGHTNDGVASLIHTKPRAAADFYRPC